MLARSKAQQPAEPVAGDIFKSLNWASSERTEEESLPGWFRREQQEFEKTNGGPRPFQWTRLYIARELYFSIRLNALLKSLGIKGLYCSMGQSDKPNSDELAWVADKRRLLVDLGLADRAVAKGSANGWFRKYLKKRVGKSVEYDWIKIEADLEFPLPDSYKQFVSTVGDMTFDDVDDQEGFAVHILPPTGLDQSYRKGWIELSDEESGEVDGLMFASTDYGDCLCFDLSKNAPDYPVYLYDHEMNGFEAYAYDFMECIQRLAGK